MALHHHIGNAMFDSSIDFLIVALGISALLVTLGCLVFLLREQSPKEVSGQPSEAVCIYRKGALVEANAEGLRLLAGRGGTDTNWRALHRLLAARFPDFPENQGAMQDQDTRVISAKNSRDTSLVTIDQWHETARVTLVTQGSEQTGSHTVQTEIIQRAPYPVWTCNKQGGVTWNNTAYQSLAKSLDRPAGPLSPPLIDPGLDPDQGQPMRLGIAQTEGLTHWFDVTSMPIGQETAYFAVNANTVVDAELAQRNLTQTLSRTFAQLPTGMAVFDRDGRLVLFNPPLAALCGISPAALSAHPQISDFFDLLRESRVAPEPARSQTWRDHVTELIAKMQAGSYSKTWELASGKSYRVSSRPQPDGAIAMLIDDISTEMALTRRFRAEIEIAHAALDALDDPVALFSQSGEHLLCNGAYRSFWRADPDSTFADYTIHDATTLWESEICDSPTWQDFREAILSEAPRRPWRGTLPLRRLGLMHATLTPIIGGATLVKFRRAIEHELPQHA